MPQHKIIYVTHYSGFMGANRALYELIVSLRSNGKIDPIVILPEYGEMCNRLREKHIDFLISKSFINAYIPSVSNWKNIIKSGHQFIHDFYNKINATKISKELQNKGYNLVHSNSSATNFGAYLAKKMGLPHIWHFRENWQGHFGVKFAQGDKAQFHTYNTADRIVAISRYISDKFASCLSPGKVTLIYDGIENRHINNTFNPERDSLNLCAIGLIHPSKQQLLLLQSINQCAQQGLTNVKLYIVSGYNENDSYYQTLKQYVDENGLQPYVIFTGYKPDAAEFIKGMDIGLLASKDEAFGRVTIEYMQAGLIPIGYNSGATPELIRDNENGFIFNSAEELTGIITRLADDSALFNQIRKKAIESANDFPLSRTAAQIAELYDQVLQSNANEDI